MLTQQERAALDTIRRRLSQRHAAIAADPELSPAGKRAARARAQLGAETEHRRITQATAARDAQASRDAYFRAFGLKVTTGDGIEADRRARERAAALENPGDAMRALASAELRGDTGMARAIAEHCWRYRGDADLGGHWNEVLVAYCDGDRARNAALGALAEATDVGGLTERLYRDPLRRPPDLQHGNIEEIAAASPGVELTGV
jgi:hypothetical protein